MSKATLDIVPRPDLGAGGRILTLDCPHATTTVVVATLDGPDAPGMDDVTAARAALARHYDAEGCRCTRQLRRRYFGRGSGREP
jgi:hypothetical protein